VDPGYVLGIFTNVPFERNFSTIGFNSLGGLDQFTPSKSVSSVARKRASAALLRTYNNLLAMALVNYFDLIVLPSPCHEEAYCAISAKHQFWCLGR